MASNVLVAGVGQTEFGDEIGDVRELGAAAARKALLDSPFEPADVDAAYVGNVGSPPEPQRSIVGQYCLREVGVTGVPVTNVENACSSSACALRHAYRDVAAGFEDIALVLGVEHMTGPSTEEATEGLGGSSDVEREAHRGFTFASKYAMMARDYRSRHGDVPLREAMTRVSVKNHRNGLSNPYAHFRKEISATDVEESPIVSDPLRLYDMCPVSDGAAAMVIASPDAIASAPADDRPRVEIAAAVHRTGEYDDPHDLASPAAARDAVERAYGRADIGSEDVDVAEIHDAATVGEVVRTEALGLCDPGEGASFVLDGHTELDGSIPVNPSGGLKARGHPIGATGVAQVNELVWQLRNEADGRQVSDAEVGVALNTGGSLNSVTANNAVTVVRLAE